MKRRTVLAMLGWTSLFGSVAFGSGGFSTTSADREVTVDVVGDEDAYLALRYPQRVSADCDATVTLTVANHTTTALHAVDIEFAFDGPRAAIDDIEPSDAEFGVSGDGQTVSLANGGSFAAGDSVILDVTLTGFEGRGSSRLSFDVTAGSETDAMVIETTSSRTVGVDYVCHDESAGCPLSVPGVSPEPAADAADGVESDDSITVSSDVDGDVVTTGDGDVTVAGAESDRVQITGRVEAGGGVSSVTDAAIGGSVVAEGGDIGGAIKRAGIGGDVRTAAGSSGDISISGSRNDRVQIAGRVVADGGVGQLLNADIGGDVVANGGDIGAAITRARVGGDVSTANGSDGDVSLNDSTVCGAVSADGDVTATNGAEIAGGVSDGDDVTVSNSLVRGDIEARGNVVIAPNSTVEGSVDADGNVTVKRDSTVDGDVSAGGDVSGSGTIEGRDPRDG